MCSIDVANYYTIGIVYLWDDVDNISKSRVRNRSHNIISIHESGPPIYLWLAIGVAGFCWIVFKKSWSCVEVVWKLGGSWVLGAYKNATKRWGVLQLLKAYDDETMLHFLHLESNILQHQHLFLRKIGAYFTCHMLGTIGQSSTYFFLLSLTQHLMWFMHNHNSYFDIVGGGETHSWTLCTLVQGCHVGMFWLLHCTKSMYWHALANIFWQGWVAMKRRAIRLKHWCGMRHTMFFLHSTTPLCIDLCLAYKQNILASCAMHIVTFISWLFAISVGL